MRRTVWVFFAALCLGAAEAEAQRATLGHLQVEYRPTPLGIDVAAPRFSWRMETAGSERGLAQVAYRVAVQEPGGRVVWDSGRVERPESIHVGYAGPPLQARIRYAWTVTVWPRSGDVLSARSWFETGLMDQAPGAAAWSGAQWIGGTDDDLVLYAPYLAVFALDYSVAIDRGSSRASFVYGANDPRLMDRYKNTYQIQSASNESYIRLELDVSALDVSPDGTAALHVYRAGYTPTDTPTTPLRSFVIHRSVIDVANAHDEHTIGVRSTFGLIALTVDGRSDFGSAPSPTGTARPAVPSGGGPRRAAANEVNLNPMGQGGDYLPFGQLCQIGFAAPAGQSAAFRHVVVRHLRAPSNTVFTEDLSQTPYRGVFARHVAQGLAVRDGRYVVRGGTAGTFVVADPSRNSMPMLRTTFRVASKAIASARLYVTARGIYELHLNGRRVGTDVYNPGLSQYNVTHFYQTYDVTSLLTPGSNAMGAMLGEGWWSGLLSFGTIWNHFGDRQSLLAKLEVRYTDGSSDTVVTNDKTWQFFNAGPIVYSSLDFGEVYDASREAAVAGWATATYDARAWKRAAAVPLQGTTYTGPDGGGFGNAGTPFTFDRMKLVGQVGNTAGVFRTLKARRVSEVRPGVFVYDLGQNIVGVPRVHIATGRAGGVVTLRVAEMLYPDLPASGPNVGMVMTENYRAALSQDVFTMKAGAQVFQPRFTSHGFQYVEVTGLDRPLPLEAVEGVAVSSVLALTAHYKSSADKVNRLWSNLVWSNVDNFLTIPTDCPQRNERMGWSGDISVFSPTATYVSQADQFLTRHLQAMRDVQTPAGKFTDIAPVGGGFGGILWGSAGIVVPWETYLQYGDVGALDSHYPAMAAYIAYLETTVDPATGLVRDAQLGDWLGPQNDMLGSPFLAAAYHAYDLDIMARVADVLGKADDAARYRARYAERRAFFNRTFVNADLRTLATGTGGFGGPRPSPGASPAFRVADTQTSYAVGLGMGLFESAAVQTMVERLSDTVSRTNADDGGVVRPPYSLMTGFIGTAWISKALSRHGRADLAYRLLLNDAYPSWLYAVNQGATTIWERLNGYTIEHGFGGNNSMNSFNHYSFGAVGQWMMAHSLGIERGEPGFRQFVLQPEPDPTGGMTWAEGYYESLYGRIDSAWRIDGSTLTFRATVPPNTSATLSLPAASAAAVTEGGRPVTSAPGVTFVRMEQNRAVFTLVSGQYVFVVSGFGGPTSGDLHE